MMKHRITVSLLALALLGQSSRVMAQSFTLATNNVAFNFTTLGLNPSWINSVTISSVSAASTQQGFFTPFYTNFNVINSPSMTNGYVVCSHIVYGLGVTYQIQISDGYNLTTTNFCIPSTAAFDVNSNTPANQWIGNGLAPNFSWSSPVVTNYTVTITNPGSIYTAGSGITISGSVISLYSAPTVLSFTNNQNSLEIGTTVNNTILGWTLGGGTATNQSIDNGIGVVPIALNQYTNGATYTSGRTYNLSVTDGVTTNAAATAVNFYSKEYWGASSQTAGSITDAQIIALGGSAFATSRQMTKTISTSSTYLYVCYPASFGAATFVVNGFPDSGWTLVTRSFVNASGASVSYNIYQHTLSTIGNFIVQVQ